MSIKFYCTHCGRAHYVEDDLAGKRVRCKICGGITKIPSDGPAVEESPQQGQLDTDYRYQGEIEALVISVLVLLAIVLGLLTWHWIVVVAAVGIALAYVRFQQGKILGDCARVGQGSFPNIDECIRLACERVGTNQPKTHVRQDPVINAFAIGFWNPFSVVLHSAAVQAMDDQELLFICGHELGHIKHHHTVWLTIIAPFGRDIPGLGFLFSFWQRKCEYTADRSGLIACRDLKAAVGAMIKISAGAFALEHTNVDEFLRQAAEIDGSAADKAGEYLGTHPYITNRIRQLIQFQESRQYSTLAGCPEEKGCIEP